MSNKGQDRYQRIKTKNEYISYYQEAQQARVYAEEDVKGANLLLTEVERGFIEDAISKFVKKKESKLLDLACGAGRIVGSLEGEGVYSVGIDSSLPMISIAKKRTNSTQYVNSDFTRLPFLSDTFDAITGFKFMINLPEKTRVTILKEMRRVVKSSGMIVVNYHLNALGLRGIRDVLLGMRSVEKVMSVLKAKREIEEAGLELVAVYGINMIVLYRILSFLPLSFLVGLDKSMGRVFPINYLSDTFIAVALKA